MAHAEDKHPEPKHEEPKPVRKSWMSYKDAPGLVLVLAPISWALAIVIVVSTLVGLFGSDDSSSLKNSRVASEKSAPSPVTKGESKQAKAPSPVTTDGSTTKSSPNPLAFLSGKETTPAPSPFSMGGTNTVTTAACAGKKHTVALQPGVWVDTDKYNVCRVVAYVPPGVQMEAMDADGTTYPYPDPNQDAAQEHSVLKVRTLKQAISFSYSRCPRSTSGVLNWDCTLLTRYAAR